MLLQLAWSRRAQKSAATEAGEATVLGGEVTKNALNLCVRDVPPSSEGATRHESQQHNQNQHQGTKA